MTFGIKYTIDNIEERMRRLERGLEKAELREKQIIIMFKMILDKSNNSVRGSKLGVTIPDIISFMEQLINKNLTPEELRSSPDLVSELVKRGGV